MTRAGDGASPVSTVILKRNPLGKRPIGSGGSHMPETPQQYTQRILGYVDAQEPLKVLANTPRRLSSIVSRSSPAKLRKKPAPEKWSIGEVAAHLADAEIVLGWRVRSVLGAPGTPIQAYMIRMHGRRPANMTSAIRARVLHYSRPSARRILRSISRSRRSNGSCMACTPSAGRKAWSRSSG
jgi:hypothetical protein